jgi:16S rRNA (guanine527-N7)-methyltransferase
MEKAPENLELIARYFSDFSALQWQQLQALDGLYRRWNAQINVISRKDIDSLYEKHVLHSLSIAAAFDFQPQTDVMDIGTGGGFPGIPLAIYFPETRFHLVDSIGKKLKVVQAISAAIGLENVSVRHIRAEEIRDQKFDVVVSRAVAPLKDLWAWSKPLLKKTVHRGTQSAAVTGMVIPNGLICLKGGDLAQEIAGSGCRPIFTEIATIFDEPYFREKYLLQVPF